MPIVPATWEAEAGGRLEPMSSQLTWGREGGEERKEIV
jgi:hypothetical protein